MKKLVRWIRGAVGIGVTWAALWVVVGAVVMSVVKVFHPEDIGPGEGFARAAAILSTLGFLSGIGFATVFSLAERKRTLRELSLVRVAVWGALGSVAIPVLMGTNGSMWPLVAFLGATFSTASVAIARRDSAPMADRSDVDAHLVR
jgi:hypothetical protein